MPRYTYEESVNWMREQPEHFEMVKLCYLDEDSLAAAKRFSNSEEFSEVIKLLKLNGSNKKLKILDVGCGNGIASYAFASLGHDVYAVDPDSSKGVGLGAIPRLASEIRNGSISAFQAFAESLPFTDSTFDVVYARQALHHFIDLHQGLAECSRVLRPKGLLFATRDHVVNDEQQLKIFLENHILHKMHGGENAYSLGNYTLALKQSGFKVLQALAPFDTVINHFPVANSEVEEWLFQAVKRKLGEGVASFFITIPFITSFWRQRLSHSCNSPGRLYSFLCLNENNR